jgi:hypothetical protein
VFQIPVIAKRNLIAPRCKGSRSSGDLEGKPYDTIDDPGAKKRGQPP